MQIQKHKSELEEAHESSVYSNATIKNVSASVINKAKTDFADLKKQQNRKH